MGWFTFSLFTVFFESTKDVFSKRSLREDADEDVVSWSMRFFALPFLIPLLFFVGFPSLGKQFLIALFIGGSLDVITTILYMKAIKNSDLSVAVPMVTFTPLFLLITSPLILGEFPKFFGLIGIILIVTGSYLSNIKEKRKGYLAPFRAILMGIGPRLMLAVAFIWSISSNIDKIGVRNSSPIFWVVAMSTFTALVMFPIMLIKSGRNRNQIQKSLRSLIPIGLCSAMTSIFQMTAINLTLVSYVISIKRTSVIMSVLFGYFIFKEKGVKERLTGASIMVIGVLFIALS